MLVGRRQQFSAEVEGHAERLIPLFPELRVLLEAVFDEAPEGAVDVITRYRSPSANLRTQLERIIRRAGLPTWERLYHNLRASRQTELGIGIPSTWSASGWGTAFRSPEDTTCTRSTSSSSGRSQRRKKRSTTRRKPRRLTRLWRPEMKNPLVLKGV